MRQLFTIQRELGGKKYTKTLNVDRRTVELANTDGHLRVVDLKTPVPPKFPNGLQICSHEYRGDMALVYCRFIASSGQNGVPIRYDGRIIATLASREARELFLLEMGNGARSDGIAITIDPSLHTPADVCAKLTPRGHEITTLRFPLHILDVDVGVPTRAWRPPGQTGAFYDEGEPFAIRKRQGFVRLLQIGDIVTSVTELETE